MIMWYFALLGLLFLLPTVNALDRHLVLESDETLNFILDYCLDKVLDSDNPIEELVNNGSISYFFNGKTCYDISIEIQDRAIKQLTGNQLSDYN